MAYQYLQKRRGRLYSTVCCDRTRGNGFKLRGEIYVGYKEKSFTVRVVRHWNRLPREVAYALSLEMFKVRLDEALSNLI